MRLILSGPPKFNRYFTFSILFLVLFFAFFLPQTIKAQGASFFLMPSEGSYDQGESFSVNVFVSSEGMAMNAAEATINFPADKLKILNISKQNSIFTLWVQEPIFSNSQGTINFVGGLPNPGFLGQAGKLFTISFQGKDIGEAKVSFAKERILANDPWGTDIFRSSKGGVYTIRIPKIFPPEVPVADKEPPADFEIIVDNGGDPTNPAPLLYFETKDDLSGMSHYEVKINDQVSKVEVGKTMPWQTPKLTPGTYDAGVKAFDKAGNYREKKTQIKIESIPIPQITTCPKVFNTEKELLYLGGTAVPNSTVIVSLEKEKELIKNWEITSDGEGDWFLAKELLVKSGIYTVTVKARDQRGAQSNNSEPCLVRVILGALSVGPLVLRYVYLTWFAIILFIILLVVLLYFIWRIHRTRQTIERESKDLKTKFFKEYKELESDIERELKEFANLRGKREINLAGKIREEQLLKNLRDVKEVLERELKDIEKLG